MFILITLFLFQTEFIVNKPIIINGLTLTKYLEIKDSSLGFSNRIDVDIIDTKNVCILDWGSKSISFFKDKQLVKKIGNEGAGPGEFNMPTRIELIGSYIFVSDIGYKLIFDLDGNFLKRVSSFTNKKFAYKNNNLFLIEHNYGLEFSITEIEKDFNNLDNTNPMFVRSKDQSRNKKLFKQHAFCSDKIIRVNKGIFQFQIVDFNGNIIFTVMNRNFNRIKHWEMPKVFAIEGLTKKDQAKLSKISLQNTIKKYGPYQDDIKKYLGEKNGFIFLQTAKRNNKSLDISVFNEKMEYYTQSTFEFDDELHFAKISKGKLICSFTNDEIGPYAIIYDLVIN